MKPSEECKAAGLEGLAELIERSGVIERTLINWHKSPDRIKAFRLLIKGAVAEKKSEMLPEKVLETPDRED